MAIYPLLTYVNFENNAKAGHTGAGFDGTTVNDATDKLVIAHYSELLSYANATPFHGAYCARVDFSKGATSDDAYFISTDNFALAAAGYYSFKIYVSPDAIIADNSDFAVFAIMGTAAAQVAVAVGRTTGSEWFIGINEDGTTPAAGNRTPLTLGKWHHVDLSFTLDDGVSDDGVIDLTVDGVAVTQMTGANQIAGTDVWFGAVAAAETGSSEYVLPSAGFMLLDEFKEATSSRIPAGGDERYQPRTYHVDTGHSFVGPGIIEQIEFLPDDGATDQFLHIYDTDDAFVTSEANRVATLRQDAQLDKHETLLGPIAVKRGAYVELVGTAAADGPFATLRVCPKYWSDGAVRTWARQRKANALG